MKWRKIKCFDVNLKEALEPHPFLQIKGQVAGHIVQLVEFLRENPSLPVLRISYGEITKDYEELSRLTAELRLDDVCICDDAQLEYLLSLKNLTCVGYRGYYHDFDEVTRLAKFIESSQTLRRFNMEMDYCYSLLETEVLANAIMVSKSIQILTFAKPPLRSQLDFWRNSLRQNYRITKLKGVRDILMRQHIERNRCMRKAAQSATLCVIWCGRFHFLGRDVLKLIAGMLWESRFSPLWIFSEPAEPARKKSRGE